MIKREKLARHPRTIWRIWTCDVTPTSRMDLGRVRRGGARFYQPHCMGHGQHLNLKIDMDGCMKNGAWWGLSCQLFTIRLLKINILDNVTMIHGSMDLSWKTYLVNVFKITTTLYLTEALMCSTIGIWSMPLVYWIKRLQCQQSVHILVGLVFGSQFGFSVLLFILVPFDVEKPIAMRWA